MIGTLWRSCRYQNTECLFLIVRPDKGYFPDCNGYKMLDLMSGRELWGYERDGHMYIPATGSIKLERFK